MKLNRLLIGAAALCASGCATGGHWDVYSTETIMSDTWVNIWAEDIEAGVFPMLPDETRRHFYASNPSKTQALCVQVVFRTFVGGGYQHSGMWRLEPGAERVQVAYGQAAMDDDFQLDSTTYAWTAGAEGTPTDCSRRPAKLVRQS